MLKTLILFLLLSTFLLYILTWRILIGIFISLKHFISISLNILRGVLKIHFFQKTKIINQDARHKFLWIAVAIYQNFNAVRLFVSFVPYGFPLFFIYGFKFSYIISIVFHKFSLSIKNNENFDANEFLEPPLNLTVYFCLVNNY